MQIRSLSLLLMIVSIAIAVLPVWRSPMISSRWPRPIGIIPSIDIRPVCTGSSTGWRWTTPGALNSTERVDHTAEELVADGDLQQVAGPLHGVALDDLFPLAEEHGADVVGLEVERQPGHPVRELEHLERHAVVEPVDPGDSV